MTEQDRGDRGLFVTKGDAVRAVRSMRLTDTTWQLLGDKADELDMSKADYLEALFSGEIDWESDNSDSNENELDFDVEEVTEILKECLTLKGNVSKILKSKITEVLEIMGEEIEEDD